MHCYGLLKYKVVPYQAHKVDPGPAHKVVPGPAHNVYAVLYMSIKSCYIVCTHFCTSFCSLTMFMLYNICRSNSAMFSGEEFL